MGSYSVEKEIRNPGILRIQAYAITRDRTYSLIRLKK